MVYALRRRSAGLGQAVLILFLLAACSVPRPGPVAPADSLQHMTVGPREVILDAATLRLAALKAWPDGNIGVLRSGSQYTFFAANSSGIGQTIGTLDNPVATSVAPRLEIYGMKAEYQYAAGGPVYRDEGTGMLLMFYHAEKWIGGDPQRFWSAIGMAKSGDEGRTWWDLGEIVAPHVPAGVHLHEITGGTFAVVGRYFHVYFRDLVRSGSTVETNNLAVARAAVSSVLHAARRDRVASWVKYHDGRWTEPGVGGRSSPLEPGNPASNFMSISYNRFTGTYLLVVVGADDDWDLYVTESPDGLAWSPRVRMEDEPGESYAPTIVGLRAEPRDSDHQFYVYYVFSAAGSWNRWNDAVLARRRITLPGTDRVRQEPPVNRGLPRLFTRESFRKMMSLLSVQATPGYNDQAHSMNCSVTAIPL